eukprot:6476324-Pyramimonas_sp.AAC.1
MAVATCNPTSVVASARPMHPAQKNDFRMRALPLERATSFLVASACYDVLPLVNSVWAFRAAGAYRSICFVPR